MAHEMFLAEDFFGKAKNIYEAIMILAKRSRAIGEEQRKEMDAYLAQVEMMEKYSEEEDASMEEAPQPHEPVLQFEKPTILALREMILDKLEVIRPEEPPDETAEAGGEEPGEEMDISSGVEEGAFPGKLDLDKSGGSGGEAVFPGKLDIGGDDVETPDEDK